MIDVFLEFVLLFKNTSEKSEKMKASHFAMGRLLLLQ